MSDRTPGKRAAVDVGVYAVARIVLAAALSVIILLVAHLLGVEEFPVTVAIGLALVVALPLGMWVFGPLRRRATASVALSAERRREDREQLRARLRGDAGAEGAGE